MGLFIALLIVGLFRRTSSFDTPRCFSVLCETEHFKRFLEILAGSARGEGRLGRDLSLLLLLKLLQTL